MKCCLLKIYGLQLIRTSEVAHQIKALVTKTGSLYLIPRTHTVKEKQCPKAVSDLHRHSFTHTHTHRHKNSESKEQMAKIQRGREFERG